MAKTYTQQRAFGRGDTPLMRQYYAIKKKYPDTLLLFRIGDFYETFEKDAETASKVLDIVLTARSNGAAAKIPLAGFPHHALDNYLPRLVRAGYRVAVCDQLEDPKSVKGIVKRGITEMVTPGLVVTDNLLDAKGNNFLASVYFAKHNLGLALLDLSTGEFLVYEGDAAAVEKLLQSYQPSEIIFPKPQKDIFSRTLSYTSTTYTLEDWVYDHALAQEKLTTHFQCSSLKAFGVADMRSAVVAAGAIMHYLEQAEHRDCRHIRSLQAIEERRYLWMDHASTRHLEILAPLEKDGGSLLRVIDATRTAMGGRLLKQWLLRPLVDEALIVQRQEVVAYFYANPVDREAVQTHLSGMGDLERLASKIALRRIHARELLQLNNTLKEIAPLRDKLKSIAAMQLFADKLDPCEGLVKLLTDQLREEPAILPSHGRVFARGVSKELDEVEDLVKNAKSMLARMQAREADSTGIHSLKIAYNRVFGYYLEVTHVHQKKVPSTWVRKQTLTNAERYTTPELQAYEEKLLGAEERILALEQQLYQDLLLSLAKDIPRLQQNARWLSRLDVLVGFSHVATRRRYTRPAIDDSTTIRITDGRHPVIEAHLQGEEAYIPNDVCLDTDSQQILLITGPNMAGKSAILRQTAHIVILAQIGSFVPAKTAQIGMVDRLFTRVGARDNLARGESTFMVEMTETAHILHHLSAKSLVMLDEIGRGTSTYDGVSIAWAVTEYLHNHPQYRVKTLFATHYHELSQLAETCPRVKNFHVSVKEVDKRVIFLRTLVPGTTKHSFGIHVAQMAGVPAQVLRRAYEMLAVFERKDKDLKTLAPPPATQDKAVVPSFFPEEKTYERMKKRLLALQPDALSPLEALLTLNELVKLLKESTDTPDATVPVKQPVEKSVKQPVEKPVEKPVKPLAKQPAKKPVEKSAKQHLKKPKTKPKTKA